MKIKVSEIVDRIHVATFDTQRDMCSTFLRFQEHYESPEFKGRVFSLAEYKEWYTRNSTKGVKTGKFTYYEDWRGFNVPSYVFVPFRDGRFDPLSQRERQLLRVLRDKPEPFYTLGIQGDVGKSRDLSHELAHGLFYTDEEYRKSVMDIMSEFDLSKLKTQLRGMTGYHEDVLDDECQAYCLGESRFADFIPQKMRERIREIYAKHTRHIKA